MLRDVFNGILFLQTMPSGMTCTYPSCFGGWSVSGQRDVTVDTAHSYHTGYDRLDAVADCMIVSDGDWGGTASYARVAGRSSDTPGSRYGALGFRLSRTTP